MRRERLRPGFWKDLPLERLNPAEWEALCDGCGKCCLIKLEDEETGAVHLTSVACRLLDTATCRCGNYPMRTALVPACLVLTPKSLREAMDWLPETCAYRLRAKGQALPAWHPLRTGDPDSVHRAGVSLKGRMIPEYEVAEEDLEDYVIDEDC